MLIREHPTYGYRRLWALLRYRLGIRANRKRIYRILKAKRWLVHQWTVTPRLLAFPEAMPIGDTLYCLLRAPLRFLRLVT